MSTHAAIDLEDFFLEEGYSKYIGDSLDFSNPRGTAVRNVNGYLAP